GSDWVLNWDSRNIPNGTYQFQAIAHYGTNTTYDCPSAPVPYSVHNVATQSPRITATINPAGWSAVYNQSATFTAYAIYVDQFGRQFTTPTGTTIKWVTAAGTLSYPDKPSTILTARNAPGSYTLNLHVSFNGVSATAIAPVKITTSTANTTNTTSPTPTPTASPAPIPPTEEIPKEISAAEATRLATMPTVFRPTEPTNSKPTVAIKTLSCLEQKVGKERFSEISSGQSAPTAEERRLIAKCFSGPDKIPAALAPVPPASVNDLKPESGLVTMDGLRNHTITNDKGDKVETILVTGTGAPNSSIFIYIFSDPMVLRAETDSQGKWSYVLQNPLEPGKHEVYAVAEKDANTFVRTPAVPVQIAAAAPNSTDGSLVIESTWQPTQIAFAGGAALMVIGALVLLLRLRRRKPAPAVAPVVVNPGPPANAPPA
ncbi:MAG: hypothetical protein K0S68_346, partial [Candidatus Saccharibacteria bacterium]|nr:hypothetical protein [Candidatus Saccharibacteria bacterium]